MTAWRQDDSVDCQRLRPLAKAVAAYALLLIGLAPGVGAQYNSPVGKEANSTIPSQASFDESYQEARWSAGPFRVQPWIGLRDASLVTIQTMNVDGSVTETDDFTVTGGAGIRAYARTSPKLVFALHALPEYSWWQDDESKRVLNGRYGAGLFGFFNRLKVEASFRRTERQDIFSTEIQQLTTLEEDLARFGFEVEIARGLHAWARARSKEYGNNEDDLEIFSSLNRSEDDVSVGLRLKSERGYRAGVGFKDLSADFDPASRNLSNEGTAVLLELGYQSDRLSVAADFEDVELEPVGDSSLEELDEMIHKLEVSWRASTRLELMLYSHRDLSYSIASSNSHLLSERTGIKARLSGGRSVVDLTYAVGEDEYEALGDGVNRQDDVTELRAALRVPVGNLFSISVYGTRLEYESNNQALDREFSTVGMAVDLGRLVQKLSLGESESVW